MSVATSIQPLIIPDSRARYRGHLPGKTMAAFQRWYDLYLQRCALAALDDRMLYDIGVTRQQAVVEASKLFWP